MNNCKFLIAIFVVISMLIIFNCTIDKNSEESSIDIKKISFNEAQNRSPKESSYQIEYELNGMVSDQNLKQNIQFKWYVEYLNFDISQSEKQSDATGDITAINSNYKQGYYFLDVSNNSLNALLTIYRPGYYKITLEGSNSKEIKENTIIIKSGDPDFPSLFVKLNIPELVKLKENDYKGQFLIETFSLNKSNSIKVNAKEMKSEWFDTGIKINPFASLKINAGSFIIDNKTKDLLSAASESEVNYFTYELSDGNTLKINTLPLVLNGIKNKKGLNIGKKGDFNWTEGNLYVGILKWSTVNNIDEFIYRESVINKDNYSSVLAFNGNEYLVKIFIGSIGHKVYPNNYFIFFGPEGTNIEELDPKNQRDMTSMPYGYLLGRLGQSGKVFPIGLKYTQNLKLNHPVYAKDANGLYTVINN